MMVMFLWLILSFCYLLLVGSDEDFQKKSRTELLIIMALCLPATVIILLIGAIIEFIKIIGGNK